MNALDLEKIADLRVKHLEMVQAIVSRMAGYCASVKNFCVTITIAICGYSISTKSGQLLDFAFIPVVVFSLLDAQYLNLERRFRNLFEQIRLEDWNQRPTFEITLDRVPDVGFLSALNSWSIKSFYIPIFVAVIVAKMV
ncbi:hypothetical protein P7D22_21375 [Lichenihabitans sp. Uapishka_5]|uniref:hypothetical protein n=1 Tax=Lichenihabitans sp. Uapishka_5 TaxID=3037302 RepID=UPI0029E81768|nr:hypothetical protein [Lichenihabitans sp. Uapishka_5]MDX7953719.1 hypothetical protein [Lichenihabitans sp. Uapishka_5]